MSSNVEITPFTNALKVSANVESLKSQIASLKIDRAALAPDPAKPIEAEVESMLRQQAKIDEKIAVLSKALEITEGMILDAWSSADSHLRPKAIAAVDESYALAMEAEGIAVRFYGSVIPGVPLLKNIFAHTVGWKEAGALYGEAHNTFNSWRENSLPSLVGYNKNLAAFLDGFPAKVAAVRAVLAKVNDAADELERRFPVPAH